MIPIADITPVVPSPLPTCRMPRSDEITEEGFGYFRGTWLIDRVSLEEAQSTISDEAELIRLIDEIASAPEEFELLASSIEEQDLEPLPASLRTAALESGLASFVSDDDAPPLDGLEIGVAGLTHALSAMRCRTAASCRSHISSHTWSDCPVVFFAAPAWRVELLAELVSSEGCGLGEDRDMLTIYGPSIRDTHRLAERILIERGRFRKMPEHWPTRRPQRSSHAQLSLLSDLGE
jgi:hypothetical protein